MYERTLKTWHQIQEGQKSREARYDTSPDKEEHVVVQELLLKLVNYEKLCNQSLFINRPRLANNVQKSIKNTTQSTVEVFKIKLDNELDSLSDSMATNNNERTMAESNSISQVQFLVALA